MNAARRGSELPSHRMFGVGRVAAKISSTNAGVQMTAERRVHLIDLGDCTLDTVGDHPARTLRVCVAFAIASAEAQRRRELTLDCFEFAASAFSAASIIVALCLFEFLSQFSESHPVLRLGLAVENRSSVAEVSGDCGGLVVVAITSRLRTGLRAGKVARANFTSGSANQIGNKLEAPGVSQPELSALIFERPVLTIFAEVLTERWRSRAA